MGEVGLEGQDQGLVGQLDAFPYITPDALLLDELEGVLDIAQVKRREVAETQAQVNATRGLGLFAQSLTQSFGSSTALKDAQAQQQMDQVFTMHTGNAQAVDVFHARLG